MSSTFAPTGFGRARAAELLATQAAESAIKIEGAIMSRP
jgi:hypothetical protein